MALLDKPPSRGLEETTNPQAEADFPTVDDRAWRQRAESEIGDAEFSATLAHRTADGLEIGPLFTAESAKPIDSVEIRPKHGDWRVAQKILHPSAKEAAKQIIADQTLGASLLWLCFDDPTTTTTPRTGSTSDRQGIQIHNRADFECLVQELEPQHEVIFDAGDHALGVAAMAVSHSDAAERKGWSFGCDPLARLATRGYLHGSIDNAFRQMADLAAWGLQQDTVMHTVLVSTQPYHEAGCSTVQELAFALATGVDYLRHLSTVGLDIDAVSRRTDFSFGVGRDLFSEVAKLRAARKLWGKAMASWGSSGLGQEVRIHSHTSGREMAQDAPRMNLLRTGAQAFAAALGGAYSIVVTPYDSVSGEAVWGRAASDSRRLALNIQHMLARETGLGRVSDPAAGSWYVEDLTDALARAAWDQFRDLERLGGMTQCLLDGHISEKVKKSAQALQEAAATRRHPIIGSSAFVELSLPSIPTAGDQLRDQTSVVEDSFPGPSLDGMGIDDFDDFDDFDDDLDDFDDIDVLDGMKLDLFELGHGPAALKVLELSVDVPGDLGELTELSIAAADAGAPLEKIADCLAGDEAATSCPPLANLRLSREFETLRQAGDRWQAELGTRPRAALVDLGGGSKDASFIRRLLAVAGIEGVETGGPESALQDPGWNLAVLCGNAAKKPESIAEISARFRAHGTRWVLVDHAGGDQKSALESAGVDGFIYDGCDVLALLRRLLEGLGAFG